MKKLHLLAASVLSTFAIAVQAGPLGPGCPAGATAGSADCPGYGTGRGPGYGPGNRGAAIQERLKAADTNADGMISLAEAQASLPGLASNFAAIDADGNGQVTLQELQAHRQAHAGGQRGEGWRKWDANGDGRLSAAEVQNAPRLSQDFATIDANGDGFLTPEELRAAHQRHGGRGRAG